MSYSQSENSVPISRRMPPAEEPKTWSIAKGQLREMDLLEGFLLNRDNHEFDRWVTAMGDFDIRTYAKRPLQPEFVLYLCTCWRLYYHQFGPHFMTCCPRIRTPDTA